MTGPCTGTANATAEASAATTVATTGVSGVTSGIVSGGGGCSCVVGGVSSGCCNTTGTISFATERGLTFTLGGLRPAIPISRNRQQIEFAQARLRLESWYSRGRQSCERSDAI